jgi:hypothetical protein
VIEIDRIGEVEDVRNQRSKPMWADVPLFVSWGAGEKARQP